jgi:hypothetical protein
VHDARDLTRRKLVALHQLRQPLGDRAAEIVGRRQHLAARARSVFAGEHDVGEGSADIDADAILH